MWKILGEKSRGQGKTRKITEKGLGKRKIEM
jgi:hypothetical protein